MKGLSCRWPRPQAGFGLGAASTHERALVETMLADRAQPHPGVVPTVGQSAIGPYLADKVMLNNYSQTKNHNSYTTILTILSGTHSLLGKAAHHHWKYAYQVEIIPPNAPAGRHGANGYADGRPAYDRSLRASTSIGIIPLA